MSWTIGVDVGGTFTDFYAFNDATGEVVLHKTPSTPANPAIAMLEGLQSLVANHELPADAISRLAHGTTVATNALIQKRGGRLTLITTKGFSDLIEIGRQIRPKLYDFQTDYPPPLVPRQNRIEVDERITAGGIVINALERKEIERVVSAVKALSPDACAICLLFSFANPLHEKQLADAVLQAIPNMPLSISSEVHSEFREYERLSTTVLNAYLHSVMDKYLFSLQSGMQKLAPQALIGVNQSSGGLMSVDRARRFPIRTALSGPAAGVIGAIHTARLSNAPNIISLDMGGTSADVSLIREFEAGVEYNRWIEGYPVRLASIDITAVGAGGGSIAWFDRDGLMKVGPQSAGAEPGPACYMRGGTDATVTDANLILGRLSPRGLIGGAMKLSRDDAVAAISSHAVKLGFSVERTALGIVDIVVANMVRAIRKVSVERGHDPRRFTLFPFGGAGPLHATEVARSLGISHIIVPVAPGILCAQGLIVADLREYFVRTVMKPLDARVCEWLPDVADTLRAEAEAWFEEEGVEDISRSVQIAFDMRFIGQNFELQVPYEGPCRDEIRETQLRSMFLRQHEQSYGFSNPDDPVEVVNVRLSAVGQHRKPGPPLSVPGGKLPSPLETRLVWFNEKEPVTSPIYDRRDLAPGHKLRGPAIIEQLDATTVIHPGDIASLDSLLNLHLEIAT
jgi:N-methylhydantoinase A